MIEEFNGLMTNIESTYGRKIRGMKVLEVGPGPFLIQSIMLAANENDATAIDLDVIPVGLNLSAYALQLWGNGFTRTVKTIARKALRIDSDYRTQLRKQLKLNSLPHITIKQGSVTSMTFDDSTFDFVYSRSVLHHVETPAAAISELGRVTKPGGIIYVSLHSYTSYNGSLDPRVISGDADDKWHWAHLRPTLKEQFKANVMLNKMRVSEWENIFRHSWVDCNFKTVQSNLPELREVAKRYISSGELQGYSLDELLCHSIEVSWQKPKQHT